MIEAEAGKPVVVMVNGHERSLSGGATMVDVLEAAGLTGRPVAVELDGEVLPRSRFADCRLAGGERIEIVTFVGGG